MAELAKRLECVALVRKRFRKSMPWIREPADSSGDTPLQTTRALELNYAIIDTVIDWMPRQKIGVKFLEDQAGLQKSLVFQYPNQLDIPVKPIRSGSSSRGSATLAMTSANHGLMHGAFAP